MILDKIDELPVREKMALLAFKQLVENSGYLNETQKTVIERLLQEIVDVWTKKDFV